MPDLDLRMLLRRLLDELDDGDAAAELAELKGRRFTVADLRGALETDEDRAALRELLADLEPPAPTVEPGPEPEPDEEPEPELELKPARRRLRPGRKAGNAYAWEVDSAGKVQPLSVARVFSGADEPDEVEIVAAKPEPNDDTGDDVVAA